MDCDFSPSSPHLLPNGLFSPQNRISFELLALSGLSGFSTFKGGKMLIFQGFASSRIVREFPPFSFKVRIATLTRNRSVTVTIRNASSVGGTRHSVFTGTFSTNEESNTSSAYYESGIQAGCSCISIDKMSDSSRSFYDAVYKNNSTSSMTISLLVGRD